MKHKARASYGAWESPITSDLISAGSLRLKDVRLDNGVVYWLEMRPTEGGRHVVMREEKGKPVDVTPPGFNVRTRVHEYGGAAFLVAAGSVFFTNFDDQRVYRQSLTGGAPVALTPESGLRFADMVHDPVRKRLVAVCEDHSAPGEAKNRIVAIDTDGGDPVTLVSGHDFYASPRLSPDGTRLAWLAWNHPNLPWDGTELWSAFLGADGRMEAPEHVVGDTQEAIFQPEWSPEGELHFVSDRTGWWNLYVWRNNNPHALFPLEAEFGLPLWVFGMSTYGFAAGGSLVCTYAVKGEWELAKLAGERLERIPTPFTEFEYLRVEGSTIAFLGGAPDVPLSVVRLDLKTGYAHVLRRAIELAVGEGYLSKPRAIEFPTSNGRTAHGFYYPPRNEDFEAPEGELPPLVVISHGGPTGATTTTFSLETQFWTSRGFGVLDVNYGGSTGYGKAYRERLKHQWGVVDVEDCVNGALYLVKEGEVARAKLAIRGGSAGGYTTLAALTFHKVFNAGASYYGVSDILALMKDTHKFESHYDHFLVGPYPESAPLYKERSPLYHIDRMSTPLILFQGLEDKVVPPNQAESMFDALKKKGVPVAYLPFPGEQHGFRRAENIKRSLDAELFFYSRIFGFPLPEKTPGDALRLTIENLR